MSHFSLFILPGLSGDIDDGGDSDDCGECGDFGDFGDFGVFGDLGVFGDFDPFGVYWRFSRSDIDVGHGCWRQNVLVTS